MTELAIVGAGRIGSLLAKSIGKEHRLLIVSRNTDGARKLADKVRAVATSDLSLLSSAEVVFLTLPADAVLHTAKKLDLLLNDDAVIVNLATSVSFTDLKSVVKPTRQIVSATIVGSAPAILRGEKTAVILTPSTEQAQNRVMPILAGFACVSVGDEKMGAAINTIAAREIIRFYARLRKELEKLGVPEELIFIAIKNVSAGTLDALCAGDLGPFGRGILEQMQAELSECE